MSTCISSAGEYSAHESGDWCPRCGAFNEEAIVAERDALRASVAAVEDRLARACWEVDSRHHLHGIECLCGFVGSARKRTQTEHITTEVIAAFRADAEPGDSEPGGS